MGIEPGGSILAVGLNVGKGSPFAKMIKIIRCIAI
jgi:hypothetical protein